jgi:hypothetical protein
MRMKRTCCCFPENKCVWENEEKTFVEEEALGKLS